MGWFSSKKKYYVSASTQKLYTDTPNLVKDSTITSIANQTSISDDITYNILNSYGLKSKSMYRYARDNYTYGLPDGTLEYSQLNDSAIKKIIEDEIGKKIFLAYSVFDTLLEDLVAREYLSNNFEYDDETGIISNPPFTPPNNEEVTFSGSDLISDNQITIYFEYTTNPIPPLLPETVEKEVTYTLPTAVSRLGKYVHAIYYEVDNRDNITSDRKFWFYDISTGTYPVLDSPVSTIPESQYYPVFPIRRDNTDILKDKSTDFYKTSRHALQLIGIKLEQIREAVNSNPEIDGVDHAYITFALHIQEDHPVAIEYLHEHFKHYAELAKNTYLDTDFYDGSDYSNTNMPPINSIRIKDGSYDAELSFSYVRLDLVTGSIGDIGTVTRINNITSEETIYGIEVDTSSLILRKQVTANKYEEVTVRGLRHIDHIYKGNGKEVVTSLKDSTDPNDTTFLIPINIQIAESMGLIKQNALQILGTRIVFNAVEVVKIRWYQTGFFRVFLIVVAVVITIFYPPAGSALYAAIAGLGYGAAVTALIYVAALTLIGQIVAIGIDQVAKFLGEEIATILAVIAVAYGVVGGVNGAPYASTALEAGTQLSASVQNMQAQDIKEIMEEGQELNREYAELLDEIETLSKDLDLFTLDPLDLITDYTYTYVDETPEQYYLRTVHTGNMGTLTLDSARTYAGTKLELPKTVNDVLDVTSPMRN